MAPDINDPGGDKNDPDEIRDGVVSDATRFPGGFIDQQITQAGAPLQIVGQYQVNTSSIVQSLDVDPQDDGPTGVEFSPDGDRLYIAGGQTDSVLQYNLSTSFDISTASFSQSFSVAAQASQVQGVQIKPDGSRLFIAGQSNLEVFQYSLSTDFDISTASFTKSVDISFPGSNPESIEFRPDGTSFYVTYRGAEEVVEFGLSTAYDIGGAGIQGTLGVNTQDSLPRSAVLQPNGTRLYLVGDSNDKVYQYSLSTDFDVTTASFFQSFSISAQNSSPTGIEFKPDGSYLYVLGRSPAQLHQYKLGVVGGLIE